jgi:hypothetical protein
MASLRMLRMIEVAIGLAMISFGAAKLASEHDATYVMGPSGFYMVALSEVAAGALLLAGRCCIHACRFVLLIAVAGVAIGFLYSDRSCGCLGVWARMTPRGHVLLASSLGILALCALRGRRRRRTLAAGQP